MTDHNSSENSTTEQVRVPKTLEQIKLELEVKKLKTSGIRELISHLITLGVAALTLYLVFMNALWDSKQAKTEGDVSKIEGESAKIEGEKSYVESIYKGIEAENKLKQTLIETERQSELQRNLKAENSNLFQELSLMKQDKTNMLDTLHSITYEKQLLENEKRNLSKNVIELNSNVNYLNNDIANLNNKLGFAGIRDNILRLRGNPYIYDDHVRELIKELQFDSKYKYETIDSLLGLVDNEYLTDIIYYILYAGTKDLKYKDSIFERIPKVFESIYPDSSQSIQEVTMSGELEYSFKRQLYCIPYGYELILGSNIWTMEDRKQLTKIIVDKFELIKGTCAKIQIS